LGGNDGNAVGSEAGYDDGTDDGTALGISVGRAEGSSPQQVAILSEISSGVHMAHVEEAFAQDD